MTEFTKAQGDLTALEKALADTAAVDTSDTTMLAQQAPTFHRAKEALEGDLAVKMEKFKRRCTEIDPVTNQPRYGDQMKKKVMDLCRRFDAAKEQADVLAALVTSAVESEELRRQEQSQAERQAQDIARQEALAVEARQALETVTAEESAKRDDEERRRLEELSRQAEEARQHRRAAVEEQARAAELERKRMADEDAAFMASVQTGVEGLEAGLSRLRQACSDLKDLKEAVGALDVYVGNVLSHPEEAKYKRIKADSVHFKSKVGSFDGGIECLLSAGFRITRDEENDVVYVIEEPDFEENKEWTQWYDAIKAVRERLKKEVDQLRRMR